MATEALSARRVGLGALVCLGIGLRLFVWAISAGTDDVFIWRTFGAHINEVGLAQTYRDFPGTSAAPVFNHPPIPGLWAKWCVALAELTGAQFVYLLKLPGLLADFGTLLLLWRVWFRRKGPDVAATAVAAYALSVTAVAISAFHGSTDALAAFLVLLSVTLAEEQAFFRSGVAAAAALNVKLLPIFAVPALFAACRTPRAAVRLAAGLSLAVLPFAPLLVTAPREMLHDVFRYTAATNYWGIGGVLLTFASDPSLGGVARPALALYSEHVRLLLAVAISGAALLGRRRGQDVVTSAMVGVALFLVLTPGFAVQYTMLVCPLLYATSIKQGAWWGSIAGLFLLLVYGSWLERWDPVTALVTGPFALVPALAGYAAWVVLALIAASHLTTAAPARRST